MRKNKFILSLVFLLFIGLTLFACSNVVEFTDQNGKLPEEITVELGELCIVPKAQVQSGKEKLDAEYTVTDSQGNEVTVTNGKVVGAVVLWKSRRVTR